LQTDSEVIEMEKTEDLGNKQEFMQPQGVTTGTVAQVTKQEMIRNLQEDVNSYQKVTDEAIKTLANYKEQAAVDLRTYELMLEPNALRKIVPERNYELTDEWWGLIYKKQEFDIREKRAIIDGHIKRLENDVTVREEALKNAIAKLKKFEEE
jgi:hypothetical protein